MRKTEAKYGKEAREALQAGVEKVFNAVAHTMGARGRNVIFKRWGMPIITNDGISIAREILPEDPYEYLGAEALKQASEQTNYDAGDGTSGTIVLATHMIREGTKYLDEGYNPMVLRKEMEIAKDKVVKAIKELAVPVKDLKEVAMISVEDEKLATLVSDVVKQVGMDGSIMVQESPGADVRYEVMRGYTWNCGFVSPYMVTNQKGEAVLDDAAVIITDRYLNLNTDLIPTVAKLVEQGVKNVFVVAENFEGELLQSAIVNKQQGRVNIVAVKKPETTAELEDLATLTNAVAVTKEKGIKEITVEHVGLAERVVVTKDRTVLIGNPDTKEAVDEKIKEVREQIKAEDQEKYGDVEVLKKRLSRLTGGVATIKVGGLTEAEQGYIKLKVDDAVGACVSAMEEGIVAGGGTTLRDLADILDGTIPGEFVVRVAMKQPYLQILKNAGMYEEGQAILNWNVLTGEIIEDMFAAGIVDPAKVIRCEIENSVSIAKTMLTTECAIVELPPKSEKKAQD